MHVNPFVLKPEAYQRDIDITKHYVDDAARFLSIQRGISIEEAKAFVQRQIRPGGQFAFKDPTINFLERNEHGDREKKECGLLQYIQDSVQRKQLIAPTFTTYVGQHEVQSILVDFIDENVKARGRAKKAMFKAEMAGDQFTYQLKKGEQRNKKLSNNAISGAHVSFSTPLANPTAHSTLTSNCRSTAGYGNANNEKFLSGNRHYWNPKIALNNIVSVVNHTDLDRLQEVLTKYGIRHPSVDETMSCVNFSTDLYWRNVESSHQIYQLIEKLSPIERSAFVYTGDLYHLAKYNDSVVRTFLQKLSTPVREKCANAKEVLTTHREEYRNLAVQLFPVEMKGLEWYKAEGTDQYDYLASTVLNIEHVIDEYADLIRALWVTDNLPASLAFFPTSIRRAALTGDTDSTIFTVQDWTFWMHGNDVGFTPETYGTEATMIFLAAETITHVLARMSANFGISTQRIHQVAMKNEFKFDVFVPTPVGKHYFALISCQEGNMMAKYKKEIKGVHLKSSNVPKIITEAAEEMMLDIMNTVLDGKKISLRGMLKRVADHEREIKRSMLAGETTYFRNAQVKTPESYTKDASSSPYQHYMLWQEVFADKYGDAPPPPYTCSKVSIKLNSPSDISKWVEEIKDPGVKRRLAKWFENNKKSSMTALLLPQQCLQARGMPEEIVPIMDIRRAIFDITSIFYLILETLGYYCTNDAITHLTMDSY